MKHAVETSSHAMVQKVGIAEIYCWTLQETERRTEMPKFHTKPSENSNKLDTKMQDFSDVKKAGQI